MKRKYSIHLLVSLIAAALIALFVYTALSKAIQLHRFQIALRSSPWLRPFSRQLAWGIPAVELLLAAGLLILRSREKALLFSGILLFCFTGYIGGMLLFAKKLPCGCGGVIETLSWQQHLVLNIVLTFLAFFGWYVERKHKRTVAIESGQASASLTGRNSRIPV
ncbi:MAG TPA: MauE/DoxX family redox-associated membrane protein [Chitinophagaceae bacterium]|nr:MauE/DoxX family redox-associated membrane protein [Chitinophagaceae bacterium]